jgi:hypothetical protein
VHRRGRPTAKREQEHAEPEHGEERDDQEHGEHVRAAPYRADGTDGASLCGGGAPLVTVAPPHHT